MDYVKLSSDMAEFNKLRMTEDEIKKTAEAFSRWDAAWKETEKYDLSAVEPMVRVIDLVNVMREDKAKSFCTRDDLTKGAPEERDGGFVIPKVVE